MNFIPVVIDVSMDDVLLMTEVMDDSENLEMMKFASRFLMAVDKSSTLLKKSLYEVTGANPFSAGKRNNQEVAE